MSHQRLRQDIAQALDATPELLPLVPELLADIWALGSSPERIVELLRPLKLPSQSTQVLDLGCGKGAVALRLAEELGFHVYGIDGFLPFITEAKTRADASGVAGRCHFAVVDLRDVLIKSRGFDLVIYAAVGNVLGNFRRCVEQLRQAVRAGGYMIIDDGFLAEDKKLERQGYEHYVAHEEAVEQLTAHGDSLIREAIVPSGEMKADNRRNTELIRRRAQALARRHPQAADFLRWYVAQQERESESLETAVTGAIWLLRRT